MTLPSPLPYSPAGPGSTVRQLAASQTPGQIAGADSPTGKALLVHEIGGGLASGGAGGQAIGQQVISAAASAASVLVGTMLVNAGSAVAGSARNNSATPGVLTITDSAGRVLARVALPAGVTTAFNPALYPLLGKAGALAGSDNDAAGNSVSLGQTPLGMQWLAGDPWGGSPALIGWTTGEQDVVAHQWSLNPANFPFTLWQCYVAATDHLAALLFEVSSGTGPDSAGGNQKVLLFDPNGQPQTAITADAICVAYSGSGEAHYVRIYEGTVTPGWWTLVDNGAGNDVLATRQNGDRMSHLVLGGGGGAGTQVMGGTVSASQTNVYPGQFNDQATGAPVWKSPTSGTWYWGSEFNYTARFQYQAAAGLYRQAIQSLTFTATFPAVPNGASVVISAAT